MSYAQPQDLIDRKSASTLGDLVSDSGTAVTETGLLTDPRIQAALDDASGRVNAAVLQGQRYALTDLAALTGVDKSYLVRITCDIAWAYLLGRKPQFLPDRLQAASEEAESHLERLREGLEVFNVSNAEAAGVPNTTIPTLVQVQDVGLIRDRTDNYYPKRFIQSASA